MQLSISQPLYFSQIGKRANNEDSIFPPEGTTGKADRIFIVCDGVGGASKGEVASRIVSQAVASVLSGAAAFNKMMVEQSVAAAFLGLQAYLVANEDAAGMATTLACLWLHNQGATLVHLGDSRIYHIRKNKILHRTADHSLVGEMVRQGIITTAEAEGHAKKNVITKAVAAGEPYTAPDIYTTSDVQAGDYFFLCSDGVVEAVSDSLLLNILGNTEGPAKQIESIQQQCLCYSTDNNSAYLVQLSEVQL